MADGAGSYEHSQTGAALTAATLGRLGPAVRQVLAEAERIPTDLETERFAAAWRTTVRDEFTRLRELFRMHAERQSIAYDQLGCTAIMLAFAPEVVLAAHVGDGRACVSTAASEWQAVITPDKGEQVGQTLFVTMDQWDTDEYWTRHASIVRGSVRGLAAMTDGCERACYRCWVPTEVDPELCHDPNEPFVRFFDPSLATVAAMSRDGLPQSEINARWEHYLAQGLPAFAQEQDDRTMVLIGRRDATL